MTFFRAWHPVGITVVDAQSLGQWWLDWDRLPDPQSSVLVCDLLLLGLPDALSLVRPLLQ